MDTKIDALLNLIDNMNEKKDMLHKLDPGVNLPKYSISEIHTIYYIGKMPYPNVSKIARQLSMTRGGVSKLIKRLILDEAIVSYQVETNQKVIYYKLTAKGREVFDEHEKRHALTRKNDIAFFSKVDGGELDVIINFFTQYNDYLEKLIDEDSDEGPFA